MRPQRPMSAVMAAVIFWKLALIGAAQESALSRPIPPEPEWPHLVGNNGCSLKGCHNGAAHGPGSEFRLWSTQDAHSRSVDVLLDARSQKMSQALGLTKPAHQAELCLKCHSANAHNAPQGPRFNLSEGVSCELCHGPASQWLEPHIRREWRAQSKAAKALFGLRDLSSPQARVTDCVKCHVGSPGFEVNHDLIAAGHPRLLFEATAFYDAMPRHWDESKVRRADPAFDAKVWLAGQAATLKSSAALMASRPSERPFPEWADHDCYACHRSLDGASVGRPLRDLSPTWGRWPTEFATLAATRSFALPAEVPDEMSKLRNQLRLTKFNREAAQPALHSLTQKLAAWDAAADKSDWSHNQLRDIMLDLASPVAAGGSEWEVAWHRYRGLAALSQSLSNTSASGAGTLATQIAELKPELRMPKGFVSPKTFDVEAFNKRLAAVRQTLAEMK